MKKLKITDTDFFKKIGKLGGQATKAAGTDFGAIAKLSHPRASYNGGRPAKMQPSVKLKKK